MTEIGNEAALLEYKVAPLSTPMPHLTTITTSQEILATLLTAQTLLLLTSTLKFYRIATLAVSKPQLSSTSHSQNTKKLPSRAPSNADVFPNAVEV